MPKSPDDFDSSFRYILIAARRAGQLISGARPRLESRHAKPTTLALAELDAGKVPWRVVTAEEYERLRQEDLQAKDADEQPLSFLQAPRPAVATSEEPESEAGEEEEEEQELADELEGPDFEAEELGEVDESMPDELLGEEVEG
jgi:DNA-directed RNA polymerase subunit K/omega